MKRLQLIGFTESFHGIEAVKVIREVTDMRLKDALELMVALKSGETVGLTITPGYVGPDAAELFDACGVEAVWIGAR